MNGQTSGFLMGLATEIRANDLFSEIDSVHIGTVPSSLHEFLDQSKREERPILIAEQFEGLRFFINAEIENGYQVFKRGEEFKSKISPYKTVDEQGVIWHMSKTQAKKRGIIK